MGKRAGKTLSSKNEGLLKQSLDSLDAAKSHQLTAAGHHATAAEKIQAVLNSPEHMAKVLEDEAERQEDERKRAIAAYHRAHLEGNETRMGIARWAALTCAQGSIRSQAEADQVRKAAKGANRSYDPRSGAVTVTPRTQTRKQRRKRLKLARDAMIEHARARLARGDRQGADAALCDAERLDLEVRSR